MATEYGSTLAVCMAEIQALANDPAIEFYDLFEKLDERVDTTFWKQHLKTITEYWEHLRAGGAVLWPGLPCHVHVKMLVKKGGVVAVELEQVNLETNPRWTAVRMDTQYTRCRQLAATIVVKATADREARLRQATADKAEQSEEERLFVRQSIEHDACLAEFHDVQERLGAAKLALQVTRDNISTTDTANMTAGLMLGFMHLDTDTGTAAEEEKDQAELLVQKLMATPKAKAAPKGTRKAAPAAAPHAEEKAAPAQSSTNPRPMATVSVKADPPTSAPVSRPKSKAALDNEDYAWNHKVNDVVYVDAQHPMNKTYDGLILMAKVEARIGSKNNPRLRVKLLHDNWLRAPDKSEEQLAKQITSNVHNGLMWDLTKCFINYPVRDALVAKTDLTTLATEYRPMDLINQWTNMVKKMERYRVPPHGEPPKKRSRN